VGFLDIYQNNVSSYHSFNTLRAAQHSKRENISKIIGVASGTTYVYIVVTKYGHVGIYDEKFRYKIFYLITS